ncbi:hypothetical protein GGX14DRAFT_367769 [Mycena pura]|uniref:ATP-dependent DNA helicase n=1 Tax=Mycena pura TaxID=153505 RepID=A0AAD6V991_9AGAR|nr:hypothetical protein GGX14DRAFT_367769 [Mycena pura]
MVGCAFLLKISQALNDAKGNVAPFGGVNIIFAGDFAQLPPVGETKLLAKLNTSVESATGPKGQDRIMGKLLWLSVNTVVMLKRIERIRRRRNESTGEVDDADPEAVRFVELLSRLREGRCTEDDFNLLNTRLVTQLRPNWNECRLRNVPIIVSQNRLKDALNEKASIAYAARSDRDLHWYHATDARSNGQMIRETDSELRDYLLHRLHSGETSYTVPAKSKRITGFGK